MYSRDTWVHATMDAKISKPPRADATTSSSMSIWPICTSLLSSAFKYGMRWWGDVYSNNNEEIYPIEFRNAYPDPNDAM